MESKNKSKITKFKLGFRKLSPEENEKIRIDSVQRVIKDKESPEKVAHEYGYNRTNVYRWIKTYRKKGIED